MNRLRAGDLIALVLFVPLWLTCLGLSVETIVRQRAYSLVEVANPRTGDTYPTVTGFKSAWMAMAALQPGDRLLSVEGSDLRGIGPAGLAARFAALTGPRDHADVIFERGGERQFASIPMGSYAPYWPRLPASIAFALTAVFLLLEARPSPAVRAMVQAYMCVALLLVCTFAGSLTVTYAGIAVHVLSLALALPLAVRSAWLFPGGEPPTGPLGRFGPWIFVAMSPLDISRFYDFPFPREVGALGTTVVGLTSVVAVVALTVRNYWQTDRIGRRQIKWFLFGAYCALLPPAVMTVLALVDIRFTRGLVASMGALGFIPIFLVIAVTRYNLFDVDRLLSATASYTVLGVILLAGLFVAVPQLAYAVSVPIGVEPSLTQGVLSLLLAGIMVPLQRRLRPRIDQVFFAERYALEQGITRLLHELSACPTPQELTMLTGERLGELLRPESLAIYGRGEAVYTPAFVRGRVVPLAFDGRGPLVAALEQRAAPIAAEGFAQGGSGPGLSPFDRAALETLGVPVVVPVRRGGNLVAFLCLGPKRSGDVYTSTDLALLAAVADKVSTELLRFDQAELIRQARVMQDALRRYVPGAVADQLASGRDLQIGEREVAVLFVDIRGYSAYAESRRATEIFSTVNRYTETVSDIVRAHQGSVVEFNGDGMMAVFGAPQPLANKERAAVDAGRQIVEAVASLDSTEPLSVGVGIATGVAFVGNVQAVDRLIWTAIGNTTNLAARLQTLARDLNAAMVIDATTWERAGAAAHWFVKHSTVAIRGRSQTQDVYALPLRAAQITSRSAAVPEHRVV